MEKAVSKKRATVFCSHGPVLPQLLQSAGEIAGDDSDALVARHYGMSTGQFVVLHFSKDTDKPHLVSVEAHPALDD